MMRKNKGCFTTPVQTTIGSEDSTHRYIVTAKCWRLFSVYIPLVLYFTQKGQQGFSIVGLAPFAQNIGTGKLGFGVCAWTR